MWTGSPSKTPSPRKTSANTDDAASCRMYEQIITYTAHLSATHIPSTHSPLLHPPHLLTTDERAKQKRISRKMDSFGSSASSNLDLTKLSDKDKQELQQFVVNESQKSQIQQCKSQPPLFPCPSLPSPEKQHEGVNKNNKQEAKRWLIIFAWGVSK